MDATVYHLVRDRLFLPPLCSKVVPAQSNRETDHLTTQLRAHMQPHLTQPPKRHPSSPTELLRHFCLCSPTSTFRLAFLVLFAAVNISGSLLEPLLRSASGTFRTPPSSFWGTPLPPIAIPLHLCTPSTAEHPVPAQPSFSLPAPFG